MTLSLFHDPFNVQKIVVFLLSLPSSWSQHLTFVVHTGQLLIMKSQLNIKSYSWDMKSWDVRWRDFKLLFYLLENTKIYINIWISMNNKISIWYNNLFIENNIKQIILRFSCRQNILTEVNWSGKTIKQQQQQQTVHLLIMFLHLKNLKLLKVLHLPPPPKKKNYLE